MDSRFKNLIEYANDKTTSLGDNAIHFFIKQKTIITKSLFQW